MRENERKVEEFVREKLSAVCGFMLLLDTKLVCERDEPSEIPKKYVQERTKWEFMHFYELEIEFFYFYKNSNKKNIFFIKTY